MNNIRKHMNILNEAFEEQPKDNKGRFMGVDGIKTNHPRDEKGRFITRTAERLLKQYFTQKDGKWYSKSSKENTKDEIRSEADENNISYKDLVEELKNQMEEQKNELNQIKNQYDDLKQKSNNPINNYDEFDFHFIKEVLNNKSNFLLQINDLLKNSDSIPFNREKNILGNHYLFEDEGEIYIIFFYSNFSVNRYGKILFITTEVFKFDQNEDIKILQDLEQLLKTRLSYEDLNGFLENYFEEATPYKSNKYEFNNSRDFNEDYLRRLNNNISNVLRDQIEEQLEYF